MTPHPPFRKGQDVYNALFNLFPHTVSSLTNTAVDCFHDNARIPDFLRAVANSLENPPTEDNNTNTNTD